MSTDPASLSCVTTGPLRSDAFKQALTVAGVQADPPATVLCSGDAGLWRLQREALPQTTVVLEWRYVAALRARAAGGPRTRSGHGHLADEAIEMFEVALVARALADDKGQVIEGEVGDATQRADNGALLLSCLLGQLVRPGRVVQAVCRTPLAPLANGLGGDAIALGEDAGALMERAIWPG